MWRMFGGCSFLFPLVGEAKQLRAYFRIINSRSASTQLLCPHTPFHGGFRRGAPRASLGRIAAWPFRLMGHRAAIEQLGQGKPRFRCSPKSNDLSS